MIDILMFYLRCDDEYDYDDDIAQLLLLYTLSLPLPPAAQGEGGYAGPRGQPGLRGGKVSLYQKEVLLVVCEQE